MTRTTNARVAGAAFLLYIGVGISAMALFARATAGEGPAARLASIAAHEMYLRVAAVLNLVAGFCALVLGVTLYGITRDEDHELAVLGLVCRVAEGVIGGFAATASLGLLWLASAASPGRPDVEMARGLGAFFLGPDWTAVVAAAFFAVGSTVFSWLLLRGRAIPVALAWLGVAASVLLVLGLLLRIVGLVGARVMWAICMPMLLFEVPLALWLLAKGVAPPPEASRRRMEARPYPAR